MEESVLMHMGECASDLIQHISAWDIKLLDLYFREGSAFLFSFRILFVEISLEILEDEVKLLGCEEYFFEFDDVWMTYFAKRFDLSEFEAFLPICIFLFHFFDGHDFISLCIDGLKDSSKGTVTQDIYYLIFLHSL